MRLAAVAMLTARARACARAGSGHVRRCGLSPDAASNLPESSCPHALCIRPDVPAGSTGPRRHPPRQPPPYARPAVCLHSSPAFWVTAGRSLRPQPQKQLVPTPHGVEGGGSGLGRAGGRRGGRGARFARRRRGRPGSRWQREELVMRAEDEMDLLENCEEGDECTCPSGS